MTDNQPGVRKIRPASKKRLARYGIERFLQEVSTTLKPGAILLDGGAGNCKYAQFFPETRTIALDLEPIRLRRYGEINLAGDLNALPLRSDSFDAVINVEVLEHLPEPVQALREIFRVLRPDGRLFLIAPQGWEEHGGPADYFRFTRFGLKHMFDKVGFKIISIEPLGGYFWYIGHRIPEAYRYLFPAKPNIARRIFDAPLRHPARFFLRTLLPYICFYLDRLDQKKTYTLNYGCICQKPPQLPNDTSPSESLARPQRQAVSENL